MVIITSKVTKPKLRLVRARSGRRRTVKVAEIELFDFGPAIERYLEARDEDDRGRVQRRLRVIRPDEEDPA